MGRYLYRTMQRLWCHCQWYPFAGIVPAPLRLKQGSKVPIVKINHYGLEIHSGLFQNTTPRTTRLNTPKRVKPTRLFRFMFIVLKHQNWLKWMLAPKSISTSLAYSG